MSIEDDIALLARVPALNLLGMAALQVLAIGAEQRDYGYGDVLFHQNDIADAGYVVRRGSFRVAAEDGPEVVVGAGELIGELALIVDMRRPATATALEHSTVVRVSRTLYQRVLESHPEAARRIRDDLAARTNAAATAIARLTSKLV
ncbi:HTH-type transcriptional regulator Cmr [Afipia felis]|jgi:CRP-like cAMP-binding protein|uniref:HTH-type transcriptional regulator Cmr n=1 Tax=Afipia felis TaxID=1035 RepID=A0A090MRW9_AFIFE|nr:MULTISPECIES: cyclic nucleotide-binding domain-containing protein [Afipia]EFI53519.1 putative transcriptional regulator, Crp/Fnr family [Afipia sp. 1NLS2]MBE0701742.1 cyclic nucleotide-binding domain-containing protein [Afipia sp.]RTL75531.1 MAG: cyclic nucleotide-binding domain-containing protein [Bradyrhizobiaceae bacterium]CEG10091.1 HTH-type transcriptional regulator Cmr [Afipia felis]